MDHVEETEQRVRAENGGEPGGCGRGRGSLVEEINWHVLKRDEERKEERKKEEKKKRNQFNQEVFL